MKTYEHVLEIVELALIRGEYHSCIEFLTPIIDSYPTSTIEGEKLRTILITALCGINKKEDAKMFCKELLKSHNYRTRENAKYLMEIIDSPEIKKPENWNIQFESTPLLNTKKIKSPNAKKTKEKEKKFINISNKPTGATKPFKKGFILIISVILSSLILLLSGCVKIQNTLDLNELDSINNYLIVESKYINKFPWQLKFEENIKAIFPDAEISVGGSSFSIKNKNLNIEKTVDILKKINQTAGDLAGGSTDIQVENKERNLIFFKKYNYKIDLNLQTISDVDNLELKFRIIHPNKATFTNQENSKVEITKNNIIWNLIPGEINTLEFSFWSWNKLFIGMIVIILIILIAYSLRFYRYKLGTDLPQLPSD